MNEPSSPSTPSAASQASERSMLRWAIRQSLIGIVILTILVAGGAWLTHNGIDQNARAEALEGSDEPVAAAGN